MNIYEKISKGEGRMLEFKMHMPSAQKIAATAVAFANGAGGEIIFGINDDGFITGIDDEEISSLRDTLSNICHNNCRGLIMAETYAESIDGKTVLILKIFPGADKPYFVKKLGKLDGVFIRCGATTRKADLTVIAELDRQKRNISFDEEIAFGFTKDDLDTEKLSLFFEQETGQEIAGKDLLNLKILKKVDDKLLPTVGGILLAGKKPYNEFCGINCARFKGNTTSIFIDKKHFTGSLIDIVEQTISFAKNYIPLHAKIVEIRRKERYELPIEAIREAVLNAVMHRDYSYSGSDIKFAIFDDIIEITSPGTLPNTLTIDEIKIGRSEVRNKVIANFFAKVNLIEKWGTGIRKMIRLTDEYDLEPPVFSETGSTFRVVFPREGPECKWLEEDIDPTIISDRTDIPDIYGLTPLQKKKRIEQYASKFIQLGWKVKKKRAARLAIIVTSLYTAGKIRFEPAASKRTNEYDIRFLKEKNLLTYVGARKNGHYELTDSASMLFPD